jgi:hypothetical protein
MAANARSRNKVTVRSSLGGSALATGLSSDAILSSNQLREKGCSTAPEPDAKPFGDGRAKVGKRRPPAERAGADGRTEREQWNALPRVIGRRRSRIVPVVGGDEEQIVLA